MSDCTPIFLTVRGARGAPGSIGIGAPQPLTGNQTINSTQANSSFRSTDDTTVTYTINAGFNPGDIVVLTQSGLGQIVLAAGSGVVLNFVLPTHVGTGAQYVSIALYVVSVGDGQTEIGVLGFTGPAA